MDIVEDIEELRELYGRPNDRSVKKQLRRFDKHCRAFIARSPFLVIASSDPSGRCDASPKGDAPGFVQVLDNFHAGLHQCGVTMHERQQKLQQ